MITETLRIGGHIKLNWHGYDEWLRIIYVWGDTIVAIDRKGKPYNLGRQNIAEYQGRSQYERGFHLIAPLYQDAVIDDQIIMAGYFNGAYWMVSGSDSPLSPEEMDRKYMALEKFTTQNIMRVFDKMLVMLPMAGSGDEVAGD